MPSILTHYLFYKNECNNKSLIGNVATQGPDPLYFYFVGIKKYLNTKDVCETGTTLHQQNPLQTFLYFYNYINNLKDEKEKEILFSYLKGIIAHYSLDSVVHPYVFYKSGFSLNNTKEEINKYFLDHVNLESIIDVLISNYYKNKVTPSRTLKFKKKELLLVSKMYHSYLNLKLNLKFIEEKTFYIATKRMKFAYKFLYSHFGIRKKIFNKYLKNTSINAFTNPSLKACQKQDYLNLNHNNFYDVTTNELISNKSVIELFSEAKEKYNNMIKILFSNDPEDKKENLLSQIINDINHDGNKVNAKKLYFDTFFK